MPFRRPSASIVAGSAYSSRIPHHRSHDSHGGFAHSHSLPSLQGSASATPQQKLVQVLVNRLKNKLPCNSGISLDRLEFDAAIQQAIDALAGLAADSLNLIALALTEQTERLSKQTDQHGVLSLQVLQSQLFILKVLVVCMSARWSQTTKLSTNRNDSPMPGTPPPWNEPLPLDDRCAEYVLSCMVLFLRQTSVGEASLTPAGRFSIYSPFGAWKESNPILEGQGSSAAIIPELKTKPSATSFSSVSTTFPIISGLGKVSTNYEKTHLSIVKSPASLNELIVHYAGRVIWLLSASNWKVVFNRLRNKIHYLASHSSSSTSSRQSTTPSEESNLSGPTLVGVSTGPDTHDLQILSHCILDRIRLIQILTELSSLLINMSKEHQLEIAGPLRGAIWSWIEWFPYEFNDLVFTKSRRMDAGPERVFDLFYQKSMQGQGQGQPAASGERVLWPTLTVLSCISSDRLSSSSNNDGSGSNPGGGIGGGGAGGSKTNLGYGGQMRHASAASRYSLRFNGDIVRQLKSQGKLAEVALVCALDTCRVASHVRAGLHVDSEDETDFAGDVPLREVAMDFAHEIKGMMTPSPGRKPFWDSSDELDVGLYMEVLVALWRFLPEEDALPIFMMCAEPERSEATKAVVVGACITLVLEDQRFPVKSIDKLEEKLGERFRDIFRTSGIRRTEADSFGNLKRPAQRPKAKRNVGTVYQSLTDREMLLLSILALWRARPTFMYTGFMIRNAQSIATNGHSDESKTPGFGLTLWEDWFTACLKLWETPDDQSIKVALSNTFRVLSENAFLPNPAGPGVEALMDCLKMAFPSTMTSIAQNLILARVDAEDQRLWMTISHQILEVYMRRVDAEHVKSLQFDQARVPAFVLLEIAYLVSLTSADNTVSNMAAQGLRLISYAERQPDAPINSILNDDDRAKRHPVYEQLGDPKVMLVGRVGHQKRIRKLLRNAASPNALHIAIWEECYWRWKGLTEALFDMVTPSSYTSGAGSANPAAAANRRTQISGTPQDNKFQWQNLTLFLAALCGPCTTVENVDLKLLANVISPKHLPDQFRALQNPVPMVSMFVSELTRLLMAEDMSVRDIARDALGAELSPRLYPKLLRHIEEIFRELANHDLSAQTNLTMFADQFMNVIKLVVENMQTHHEEVIAIDLSATMLGFATFISKFNNADSLRIKTKFCTLCESVCDNTSLFTLRKDNLTRHSILHLIVEWLMPSDPSQESSTSQNELNFACLKTCVKLLDRLELKPLDTSSAGDDSAHVVARLFNKYSTMLLDGIKLIQSDIPTSDSASDVGSMQTASPFRFSLPILTFSSGQKIKTSTREAELRDHIITGLAHLVSANTESGFKQCLPLAYSEDNRKRAIFAHVFARVISQGTKFDPEESPTSVDRQSRLSDLVKASDMTLVLAICETCPASEVDSMISVLLNLFDSRASLLSLVKLMIDREVSRTENEAALFRSNSTCTRFLSAFARIHGYNYLRGLIRPLIRIMEETPQGYELDPNKAAGQDVQQNRKHIEYIAAKFLDILDASSPTIPLMFREICMHIAKTVVDVWPDAKFAALGAFMFLRFISPAIVSPETIDIDLPNESYRRGCMVNAKIIQNMANNIFFGKEVHMTVLNDFLGEHIADVTRYLSSINRPPNEEVEEDDWLGTTTDDTDIIVLHRFFDKHADKIGKELLSISRTSEGDVSAISGKRAWDSLCTLLVDLGPPLEIPRLSTWNSLDHLEYQGLLTRFANRATDSVHDIFLETECPSDQDAFFILRLSKIDVEVHDVELLMYYIFKLLALPTYEQRSFSLILDCTGFVSTCEVPLRWLKFCAELTPSDIRSRFMTTHILNPNALAQKYLRRLYNVSGGIPFCTEVRISSSVTELLEQHVPESVVGCLGYPYELEQEPREVYLDVTMKSNQMRLPVELVVGLTHIRITSIRAQSISPNLSCKSTEIVPMVDIGDVYSVSTGQEVINEFIIRRNKSSSTMYLTSPVREIIVKTIRLAKGRLKETTSPLSESFSRFSNVPATLLHVGLQCVDINDEELRASAYDLLGAVCTYLNFDKSPIVAAKAGFIPGDANAFAIQLSERIADFAPQLTLDFISEVSASMNSEKRPSPQAQRIACLSYMSPWIKNLSHFSNPISPHYERSGARLRDCIRVLCDSSIAFPELMACLQRYVWAELGKLDTLIVDVVLDELIRSAMDAGINSIRCETIANIIASLSSISVRGRLLSRLRKAVIKASPTLARSFSNNSIWGEVSVLLRLTLIAGFQFRQPAHNQLYVPEVVHIVALVAGLGSTTVRKTVYGITMNLLQALYFARIEEGPAPEILQLITECGHDNVVKMFGLTRATTTSEYTCYDPPTDKVSIDNQEELTELLGRIIEVTSGTRGLLNVWRGRWMSLITASAFQYSSVIQMRSFTALGSLATAGVDDDLLYQMLVALKAALSHTNESDTLAVVSMLRTLCKVVPALPDTSRFLVHLVWLAVAFLQASHVAFYVEATRLLRVALEDMERRGMFANASASSVLIEGRLELEDTASQFDQVLGLTFDQLSFSFSLAAIIFKGVRHAPLRDSAESVLRSLLKVTVRSPETEPADADGLRNDALGYFLALLPLSATPAEYRRLLKDCEIDEESLPESGIGEFDDETIVPRVLPSVLGISDVNMALLATSFIGAILYTAQGDDMETEVLFNLLADIATVFPETVAMTYESLHDRIKDVFANASSPSIMRSVSDIIRISLQDVRFPSSTLRGSASSINTVEDHASVHGAGRNHLNALEELNMQGLVNNYTFLPLHSGHATKVIQWIPELLAIIVT